VTTPVGAIRLDLTVDGSGMWGDISRDVMEHMGPIVAQLNAVEKRYDALGSAAEKAGAKQAAANKAAADSLKPTKQVAGYESIAKAAKEAAEAIERIAAAEKLRDKGVADSAARVAAMDREAAAAQREARDMTELAGAAYAAALAVDKLAAANARAAVGPKPDYNRPNVPPSGGGGGRSGGGGLTGGGGFLGTLFSPVGVNAIALSTKAIAPMALGIAEVVRSAQDLVGVGALLPGLIAGIGASGGTAAIGLKGMGDAIGAMYKAAQEGASKSDLKKAAAAIKDLDSNAKEVAVTVASDLLPAFKKLQTDVVQHNMFDGIAATVKDTTEKLLPSLKTGLGSVSSAWNGTFKTLLGTAGSDSTKGFLDRIFGNTAEAQTRANAAIAPLTHALGEAAAQGTNFLPRLADGLTAVTTRFDNFITKAIGDGRFDKWIDNGLKAVGDLGESFLNVGKILNDITGSLGGGQTFLGWLREATGQLHTFLSSADGQNKLSSFFQSAREEWSQIKPVLGDLAKIAGDVVAGFHDWGGVILPIVGDVAHALASMPQLIEGAVVAFAAFKTLSVFDGLLGGLGRVNSGLGETTTKAETLGARFGSLLKTAGLIAGVDLLSKGITGTPGDGKTSLQTIGGSAAIGFGVAGLPGAAVGAGVGIGADEIRRLRAIDNFNRDNAKAFDTPASQADEQARKALYALTFGPNGATKDTLSLFTDQSNIGGQTARQNLRDQVAAGQVNIPGVNAENFNTQFGAMIKNAQDAQAAVEKLGGDIQKLPDGKFQIVSPTDEEIKKITDLGLKVEHLPDGRFVVDADTTPADNKMKAFLDQWSNAIIQPKVLPPGGYTPGGGLASLLPSGAPGHAAGGVVPGYAPGVDESPRV